MVYGAGATKRERRTKAAVEMLDDQILDVLMVDHPQSVRHVFYMMTDPRLGEPVEKSERGYRHVQHRVTELRRAGRLPYGWITDATRRGHFVDTYTSASEFLASVAGLYRADMWRDADTYCEVWTESRSIAGVVERDCRDLAVSLYPCGGFSSISLAHDAAQYINYEHADREVVILYIGDYDPAGVLIDVALERELRLHLDESVLLRFERIAITAEQIDVYRLPTKPRKRGDRRSPEIKETVEAEAMPAHVMRQLLRDHIESMLPNDALAVAKVAERSERMVIESLAETLKGAS